MSLSSSYFFLTRKKRTNYRMGFPKASPNFIAPAHVIRDLHQGLRLSCRRCLTFLVCPLCANPQCIIRGRWNAVASCHAQTSRSSSVVRITEITGLNECQIDQVPRAISWSRLGLCGFVSAECSPMLLAGEQAPLSSPRRRHNGHGRTCHWFGPVANGPKRSFCLDQNLV